MRKLIFRYLLGQWRTGVEDRAIAEELREVPPKYLLPCSCGEKIPVEIRQAGQTITCTCGVSLEVPAMLQIKRLEKVVPGPEEVATDGARRQGWGALEGLALLGLVIVLSATGTGIWLFIIRPKPYPLPQPDGIREATMSAPPQWVWSSWRFLRATGLNPRPFRRFPPNYGTTCFRYRVWMGTTIVIGLLGLVLTVTMVSLRNRVGRARPPSTSGETG